jgi:energy-coupling factor transport system permease protein
VWAAGLALTAASTANPLLLVLIAAVVLAVVVARRGDEPWAMSLRLYVGLAVAVVVIRVAFRAVFADPTGTTVLLHLPVIQLPGHLAGIQLLGPLTAESLLAGVTDGLRLGVIILAVGAANCLASPKRLLASVPRALYEAGTVIVVALTAFPQLAASVTRVRRARRVLEVAGRPAGSGVSGPRAEAARRGEGRAGWFRGIVVPVLADALDGSLALAAAMDARGFGRVRPVGRARRRATALAGCGALLGLGVSVFALLSGGGTGFGPASSARGARSTVSTTVIVGVAALAAGLVLLGCALRLLGGRVVRTRYRRQPWGRPEWAVAAAGAAGLAGVLAARALSPAAVIPAAGVLAWPAVPILALVGLLAAASPLWLPVPPARRARPGRTQRMGAGIGGPLRVAVRAGVAR